MALSEDLKIYRSMYDLTRLLIRARNQFDKSMKYVVGERMISVSLDCLTRIHFANEDKRKGARVEHLDKFLMDFDVLKTLIMVCRDERQFKRDSLLGEVYIKVADVETQATAWRKSARKPELRQGKAQEAQDAQGNAGGALAEGEQLSRAIG